jgi:hypothetical protein
VNERVKIEELRPGDVVRWSYEDNPATVDKVQRDRDGFDVLYHYDNGQPPRWRGFDDGDTVQRITAVAS